MQIPASHADLRGDSGLQLGLREQNNTALETARRVVPEREPSVRPSDSSSERPGTNRAYAYSSYSSKNVGAYRQAILAYQEAARFEESGPTGFSPGPLLGEGTLGSERALTDALRNEPENSAAWHDLGVFYYTQGRRDKVSAIYQILQELDPGKAERFSTQLGLHEKMLFTVV